MPKPVLMVVCVMAFGMGCLVSLVIMTHEKTNGSVKDLPSSLVSVKFGYIPTVRDTAVVLQLIPPPYMAPPYMDKLRPESFCNEQLKKELEKQEEIRAASCYSNLEVQISRNPRHSWPIVQAVVMRALDEYFGKINPRYIR
ncbi:MAG: hypothetical protein Q8R08_00845 [bacterium]|nr:hypothetical protein [bacterium]